MTMKIPVSSIFRHVGFTSLAPKIAQALAQSLVLPGGESCWRFPQIGVAKKMEIPWDCGDIMGYKGDITHRIHVCHIW